MVSLNIGICHVLKAAYHDERPQLTDDPSGIKVSVSSSHQGRYVTNNLQL